MTGCVCWWIGAGPGASAKEHAAVDLWLKDAAPSEALLRWTGRDPGRWKEFKARYRAELASRVDLLCLLGELTSRGPVTVISSLRDAKHNDATVLLEILEERHVASKGVQILKAKDIMTTQVITIGPDTLVPEIASLLLQRRISGLPVVDRGRVIGMVSEGDLLRRYEIGTDRKRFKGSWWMHVFKSDPGPAEYVKSHAGRAADIMTRPVVCIHEDLPIAKIAGIFEKRRIKRVPVTSRRVVIAGLVAPGVERDRHRRRRALLGRVRDVPGQESRADRRRERAGREADRRPPHSFRRIPHDGMNMNGRMALDATLEMTSPASHPAADPIAEASQAASDLPLRAN